MPTKSVITFINHASVTIASDNINLLCDPWFSGDVFHKGWNLLVENSDEQIKELLKKITHIWISHEHPDHFSIKFFNTFTKLIKERGITILFQETKDKRVEKFLLNKNFSFIKLPFNNKITLTNNFSITCLKDGFYDSALLIQTEDKKILNLNDCAIISPERINEIFQICGKIDVLLTQFSYAAWKGGVSNKKWRQDAAKEKLNTINLQVNKLNPSFIIPFASFAFFSNELNFYLNDATNKPSTVVENLISQKTKVVVMKPLDIFNFKYKKNQVFSAIKYWDKKYSCISKKYLNKFDEISLSTLIQSFSKYTSRIHAKNNQNLMKIAKIISPIKIFQPISIHLIDLNRTLKFDICSKTISVTNEEPHLKMSSESLNFIFLNTFGFDTLTVNGCFEEVKPGGFIFATKTLAIENLNNLGIYFKLSIFANPAIIKLFLSRIIKVSKKLKLTT